MASGVFLASFAKNLYVFILLYSLVVGFGTGVAYTAPMVAGWKWFPQSKGAVSGSVLLGFGAGGFFFNLIGTRIINPDGLQAVDGVFPKEVLSCFYIESSFTPGIREMATHAEKSISMLCRVDYSGFFLGLFSRASPTSP